MPRFPVIACAAALATLAVPAAASAGAQPLIVKCDTVAVQKAHGGHVPKHSHLSEIRGGRVLVLDPATSAVGEVPFRSTSGRWIAGTDGKRYAVANQWISRTGKRGGRLQVAARTRSDGRIRCAGRNLFASAADTASYANDGTLGSLGYVEQAGSARNMSDRLLDNHATRDVLTNMPVHPDGAARCANAQPTPGIYCYTGRGAAMNDPYGAERYAPSLGGAYIDSPYHRHYVMYSGATVAAAKRQAVKPDGTVITNSPIVWRIVAKNANIAN